MSKRSAICSVQVLGLVRYWNPLLVLCVAAGLLPIGVGFFTSLRSAARG